MEFVFGLPEGSHKNNGILLPLDRFSKIVHPAVNESISAHGCARVFIDTVFPLHGLPRELVPERSSVHGNVLAIRVPISRNTSNYVYF